MQVLNLDMYELDLADLESAAGGIDWGGLGGGLATYGGATMALLMYTGPIGWGIGAAYLLTCAGAGMMIGSSLVKK